MQEYMNSQTIQEFVGNKNHTKHNTHMYVALIYNQAHTQKKQTMS